MSDLGTLKARVGAAARRIIEASTARRSHNQALMQSLTELEAQFRNHEQELSVLLGRLGPLERSNAELVGMIDRLVALAEGLDDGHLNTTLFRASSVAGDLVELTARLDRNVRAAAFEDVPAEALAAEIADEAAAALPEPVVVAMAAAAEVAPRNPAGEDIQALFARAEAAAARLDAATAPLAAAPAAAAPKRPRRKRTRKAA